MHFLAFSALLSVAYAAITPTSPDGATVVKSGGTLTALWTADTTGSWQNTQIQLMTGDNFNMVPLQTLASGIDGTTTTTWSGPVPDVSPNSKIYFLQFTKGGDVTTATWTTRFTIAAADGTTTEPTNSTVYNGTPVQWGTGAIVGAATNGTVSPSASSNSTGSAASSSAVASVSTVSVASSSATSASASMTSSTSARSSGSSASAASAATTTSRSAAHKLEVGSVGMAILGLVGALML